MALGMGVAVAIAWSTFFRSLDSYGLDLGDMLQPPRVAVYATQFLLVGAFFYVLARRWLRGTSSTSIAVGAGTAWLLEGLVLTLIGEPIVANELDPAIAWYYWLSATAGPLQPMVAFLGGWVGLRHAARERQPARTGG